MAQPIEQAAAAPTTPVTAPATPSGAPAVDAVSTTVGKEAVSVVPDSKPVPITAFKKMSADDIRQLQEDFSVKLSNTPRTGPAVVEAEKPAVEAPKVVPPGTDTPNEPVEPVEAVVEPIAEVVAEPAIEPDPADPDPEPEPGKPPQHRIRGENAVEDMALTIKRTASRNGRKMSFTEAEAEAKRVLGVTDTPAETAPAKTVESLQSELTALREQRKAAKIAFDNDAEDAAQNAIEDKIREIDRTERDVIFRRQAEESKIASTAQNSRTKAATLYPGLLQDGKEGRPLSEIAKAAGNIHAALVEAGDPAVNAPDYLLDLASRAAKLTNTPPGKTPVATKTTPRPTVQPAKPVAPLGSATARTSQPGAGTTVKEMLKGANPRQLASLVDTIATRTGRL